ncbi:MAG: hypothetical protein WCL54_00525 [Clostridia bacterium]
MAKKLCVFIMVIMFSVSSISIVFSAEKDSLLTQIKKQIISINKTKVQLKTIKAHYFQKHDALIDLLNAKIDELYQKINSNRTIAETKVNNNSAKQSVLTAKFKKSKSLSEKELYKAIINDLQSQSGEINLSLIEDISIFADLINVFKLDMQKINNIFFTTEEINQHNLVKKRLIEQRLSDLNKDIKQSKNETTYIALLKEKLKLLNDINSSGSIMINTYAEHLERLKSYIIL